MNKIQKFMHGRYGTDELYKFLFILYIVLVILNLFLNNTIILILELLLIFIIFYRFLSKNIYARSNENQMYLKIRNSLSYPFKNINRNRKDKQHIYKKCHKCKTTLKLPLPSERGIKHAKCPKCGKRVTFFTFRKEKIEVIMKKK